MRPRFRPGLGLRRTVLAVAAGFALGVAGAAPCPAQELKVRNQGGQVSLDPSSDRAPRASLGLGDTTDRNRLELVDVQAGDNAFPVALGDRYGLMTRRGELIRRPLLDWADFDYDGVVHVVYQGRTGFIDLLGNGQIEPTLPWADRFSEDLAVVSADPRAEPLTHDYRERGLPRGEPGAGPVTFVYRTGRPFADAAVFDQARRFKDGLAAVRRDGACGFVDRTGGPAVPLQYAGVRSFHDHVAAAAEGWDDRGRLARFVYLNRTGKVVHRFGPEVTLAGDFNDNLAWVRVRDRQGRERFGYIDRSFDFEIPPRFERARDFTNGVAAVRHEGKWGYIDRRGAWVVQPAYDAADDFDDTLAPVGRHGAWGYVDRTGRLAVTLRLTRAEPFFRELARASVDDRFGYLDLAGRAIYEPGDAARGIVDQTRAGDAVIAEATLNNQPSPSRVRLFRDADPPPEVYPPDHLYDEGLPVGAWNGYRIGDTPIPAQTPASPTATAKRR
ncbi:MAG: WG repeat-containing protein [Planctomycetota bacterium]